MHHATSWQWDFHGGAGILEAHANGLHRLDLVNEANGSTHSDLALFRLEPGGHLEPHVHAYESCLYVLRGEARLELDGRAYELQVGDYALVPLGVVHALRNPGTSEFGWLELATPIPARERAAEETLFYGSRRDVTTAAARVRPGHLGQRWVGHYDGTPPQSEALAVGNDPRSRAPIGMDTAILAYSGISVKMMVDSVLGADLLTMFMVDYEPGGAAQLHDHPFEEAYFFVEGEIEGDIEGKTSVFRAGDLLFCPVGVRHAFYNTSGARVRWIETQAPQPPRRHAYRWPVLWERLREELAAD